MTPFVFSRLVVVIGIVVGLRSEPLKLEIQSTVPGGESPVIRFGLRQEG